LFDNTKTAIVVGVSGLSCTLELEKNGYRVQILEKEKHLGGRVHSDIIASSSIHGSMYSGRLTAKQIMTN